MKEKSRPALVTSFLFHEVTNEPMTSGFQNVSSLDYKHGKAQFAGCLKSIQEVEPVAFLVTDVNFNASNSYLCLTFDDGGKSALYIADQLEEFGWEGHFFVTTNQIGTTLFLSRNDIRELRSRGHVVGAHTHSHYCPFYLLESERQKNEFEESIAILSDIIGEEVVTGSVPGGDLDKRTMQNISDTGIRFCFTSEPSTKQIFVNETVYLGRFCPKRNTSEVKIGRLTAGRGVGKERLIRFVKNCAKRIVYPIKGTKATPWPRYEESGE